MGAISNQDRGCYLQENQGWEFGLISSWRQKQKGFLYGVPHFTIRFWDLRYFFDKRYFKKQKKGTIINVASMYGVVAPNFDIYKNHNQFMSQPNYGTAKAGVIHLSKYYAMYLGKYNINVNSISPGPFPSEYVQKDKEFIKRLESKTKLKRIGKPEDLRGIILLLSSSLSSYITGQNIAIDGGWTI